MATVPVRSMVTEQGNRGASAAAANAAITQANTVVLVSSDAFLRERLRKQLRSMRWNVEEAGGGAEALMRLEAREPAAVLLDSWLPDLEAGEFARQLRSQYPDIDLLHLDGTPSNGAPRSARRNELLHALREVQEEGPSDGPAWSSAPLSVPATVVRLQENVMSSNVLISATVVSSSSDAFTGSAPVADRQNAAAASPPAQISAGPVRMADPVYALPEMVGDAPEIRELGRMIRLVAPRTATVLIEGETGTGKELVAKAVHRLSERAGKPFVVLNCAAIPEQLLEAELFGHTRGAFTGAVTSRTGRIEAAHGGTLFLDEIGEMPLALQAKMLRFLECGELQRIGDNDVSRVDVRIVAATHQELERQSGEGLFRLDLFHRLAVFPVHVPSLRDRMEDLSMLVRHGLRKLGETMPQRRISVVAMEKLAAHTWPGNVRELMHVLERASILAGDRAEILAEDIRFRRSAS